MHILLLLFTISEGIFRSFLLHLAPGLKEIPKQRLESLIEVTMYTKSLGLKGSLLLTMLAVMQLPGQQLQTSSTSLNFPVTTEIQPSSQTLMIYNRSIGPLTVKDVDLFQKYGSHGFAVSDTQFTIAGRDSFALQVSFQPEHNVQYQQALVLRTETGRGARAIALDGQGSFSRSYYSSTENQSQQSLKAALKTLLAQNYNSLSYRVARDNMYASIDNNGGQVEGVYTGRMATFNTRAGANANSFNCEHTFPQGFFNQNLPMRSDIHHLFPTDVAANSRRANDPFGLVSNPSWSQGGSKSGGGKFEPRDVQKGASARALMYFVIRYQDYANHVQSQEAILRQWHRQYPPQTAEQNRNDAIYNLQNNRNPFVDYPQFLDRIENLVGTSTAPSQVSLYRSTDTIAPARGPGNYVYGYVLYNNANQRLTLNNFALNGVPGMQWRQGNPGTVQLEPGEYYQLDLSYPGGNTYTGSLTYRQSSTSGLVQRDVPIRSGGTLRMDLVQQSGVELYPNPVQDGLTVELTGDQGWSSHASYLIRGITGKVYGKGQFSRDQKKELIPTAKLSPGLYFLEIQDEENRQRSSFTVVK